MLKIGLVLEDDFNQKTSDHFSEYCKLLIPYVQKLWKEVFPRGETAVKRGSRTLLSDG